MPFPLWFQANSLDLTFKDMTAPLHAQVPAASGAAPSAWFPFSPLFLTQTSPSSNTFPAPSPHLYQCCVAVQQTATDSAASNHTIHCLSAPVKCHAWLCWVLGSRSVKAAIKMLSGKPSFRKPRLSSESSMQYLEAGGMSPSISAGVRGATVSPRGGWQSCCGPVTAPSSRPAGRPAEVKLNVSYKGT